jgi:hypothetical protein
MFASQASLSPPEPELRLTDNQQAIPPLPLMPAPPRGAPAGALVLSALLGLSAVVFAVLAALHSPKPAWFMMGFELVMIAASAMGILTGLGRFREGPAMALGCVAAVTAVAAYLGYLGAGKQLYAHSLLPLLVAREGLAACLAVVGAWMVLARRPDRSLPAFLRGVACGVPIPLLLAAAWRWRAAINTSGIMQTMVATVGFLVLTGLLAASVHLLIRAFQFGRVRAGPGAPILCVKCGYDLAGTPAGPCPECGTPTPPNPDDNGSPSPARGPITQPDAGARQ